MLKQVLKNLEGMAMVQIWIQKQPAACGTSQLGVPSSQHRPWCLEKVAKDLFETTLAQWPHQGPQPWEAWNLSVQWSGIGTDITMVQYIMIQLFGSPKLGSLLQKIVALSGSHCWISSICTRRSCRPAWLSFQSKQSKAQAMFTISANRSWIMLGLFWDSGKPSPFGRPARRPT